MPDELIPPSTEPTTPPNDETKPPTDFGIDGAATESGYTKYRYPGCEVLWQKIDRENPEFVKLGQNYAAKQSPLIAQKNALEIQLRQRLAELSKNNQPPPGVDLKEYGGVYNPISPELDPLVKQLRAQIKAIEEQMKRNSDNYQKSAEKFKSAEQTWTDIVAAIQINLSDEKLSEANVDNWDASAEIMGKLGIGDFMRISLGYYDAASDPRYKIQPIFQGIITALEHNTSTNGSKLNVILNDERILGTDIKATNAFGDGGIGDDQFANDVFSSLGLISVAKGGGEKAMKIPHQQTIMSFVSDTAQANGQKTVPVIDPVTGDTVFMILPKNYKDKLFIYSRFENIIDSNISLRWESPDDRQKQNPNDPDNGEGGEGDPGSMKNPDKFYPENGGQDSNPQIKLGGVKSNLPIGNDPTPSRGKTQNANASNEIIQMLANVSIQGSFSFQGEPTMSMNSAFLLTNYSPKVDGLWEVKDITHNYSTNGYVSNVSAKRASPIEKESIDQNIKDHLETGKYEKTTPVFTKSESVSEGSGPIIRTNDFHISKADRD